MGKKSKILIVIAVFVIISVFVFIYIKKQKKSKDIAAIYGDNPPAAASGLEPEYLAARAKAVKDGSETFYYKDKMYITATGRGVVANTGISGGTSIPQEDPKSSEFNLFDYKTWF